MQVTNTDELLVYLDSSRSWLMRRGAALLGDPVEAEDVIQELALFAHQRLRAGGDPMNSRYLGQRFSSLLRDARRNQTRWVFRVDPSPARPLDLPADTSSVEDRVGAREAIAHITGLPHGALMIDAFERGVADAARDAGQTNNWLYQQVHRFRRRNAELAEQFGYAA